MAHAIPDTLSKELINELLSLEEVVAAKKRISERVSGAEYFSIALTPAIREFLSDRLGFDATGLDVIPMRWIKGDTHPHVDAGARSFEKTHLVYLSDSPGVFVVGGDSYPIAQGCGYVFPEGLRHETVGTGAEPRLLMGPMSEAGFAVGGATTISASGVTDIIYFKNNSGTIGYKINNGAYNSVSLPVTIINTDPSAPLQVLFESDLTFQSDIWYFICGSDNIQFGSTSLNPDGSRPVITISGVTNYPGLIQNGTAFAGGQNNISVFNLEVAAVSSTLKTRGGWIGQQFFCAEVTGNYIVNCSSSGPIPNVCGGIVGTDAARYSGGLTIIGCSNSGTIGQDSGGIVGTYPVDEGSLVVTSCWNTGAFIGPNAGGIIGAHSLGLITITNCYNTGSTVQINCGGIIGFNTSPELPFTITNCYNTGNLSGPGCGGIIGPNSADTTIMNCYSTGNWNSTNGGGICGNNYTNVTVDKCYTSGVGGPSGYIYGGSATVPPTCYSEAANSSSGWNTVNANTVLTGEPTTVVGTTWVSTGTNQPYELKQMGYTPYSATNITTSSAPPSSALIRTASATVTVSGGSMGTAIVSGSSYQILDVVGGNPGFTINATTGSVTAAAGIPVGVYLLYVRNTGSYNITEYEVTVTEEGITCCAPIQLRGLDYTTRAQIVAGDNLVQVGRKNQMSYSELMSIKKANASR